MAEQEWNIFPANAGGILMQCVFKGSEEYIPRERGGHPLFERLTFKVTGYSPRMRGSTYGGVSGCRYANIPLRKQGCHSLRC